MPMQTEEILAQLTRIDEEAERKKREVIAPARQRLQEIAQIREQLADEEVKLRRLLGLNDTPAGRMKRGGKTRLTQRHKTEIMAKFIHAGHIRDKSELTRELRAALVDEGYGQYDFRKLNNYMPSGWEAISNGVRGFGAKTTFHKT